MQKSANLPGVTLSGDPASPALVILHSSLSSSAQWSKLCKVLSSDYYIVNMDLIGYGQAPQVTNPQAYSLEDETARITLCLQHLGISQFSLIGHSFGGAVALRLAHQKVGQVKQVALFEPVAFHLLPDDSNGRREIDEVAGNIDQLSPIEGAAAFVNYWNGPGYFARLPDGAQQMMAQQIGKVKLDFKGLMSEPLAPQDYAGICQRGLLMTGAMSPQASIQVADVLHSVLPDWVGQQVSGGHMSPISHSSEVNQHIIDFLLGNK